MKNMKLINLSLYSDSLTASSTGFLGPVLILSKLQQVSFFHFFSLFLLLDDLTFQNHLNI